jgi:GNAT superfamily N-acetyltransferase
MNNTIIVKKIKRNLLDYGWPQTLQKGISFFLRLLYAIKVYRIYTINLGSCQPAVLNSGPFIFKLLDPRDQNAIRQIEAMEEWLDGRIGEKISTNSWCMVAMDNEKVAGFNLITVKEIYIPLINKKRLLRPGIAWSEQITVQSDYRNRGLGTNLRQHVIAELKKRGINKLYGGTLKCNIASLKLAKKSGFTYLVDVHYSKLLNTEIWKYRRIRA